MREIIERGHIFIAMPPLYKVKKGKQEQYLKDEAALEQYLTQSALDGTKLFVNAEAPAISGAALEALVSEHRNVENIINKLSRVHPALVLEKMIDVEALAQESLKSEESVKQWSAEMGKHLGVDSKTGMNYVFGTTKDEERDIYLPMVSVFVHGISTDYIFNHEFFESSSYQKITHLGESISGIFSETSFIQRGEKQNPVSDFKQAMVFLMKEAKRGLMIQRYKGLGEMNPEQLWETTMDPDCRRMMQVNIEDAVAADQIFTTLMGDEVEPRRDFIQANALDVSNLDV
jgi:DNA gyrase subunit B